MRRSAEQSAPTPFQEANMTYSKEELAEAKRRSTPPCTSCGRPAKPSRQGESPAVSLTDHAGYPADRGLRDCHNAHRHGAAGQYSSENCIGPERGHHVYHLFWKCCRCSIAKICKGRGGVYSPGINSKAQIGAISRTEF